MQIHGISNQNFQANKVLTVKRALPKSKQEIIEVFRLNEYSDTWFAAKCMRALSEFKTRELNAFQKRLKNFFLSFLNPKRSHGEDFYLAIKNGNEFCGILNTAPFMNENHILNMYSINPKFFVPEVLFYTLLNDSQKRYSSYNLEVKNLEKDVKYSNSKVDVEKFEELKTQIDRSFSGARFVTVNDEIVDLDEYLGTQDFETEAYPNLTKSY